MRKIFLVALLVAIALGQACMSSGVTWIPTVAIQTGWIGFSWSGAEIPPEVTGWNYELYYREVGGSWELVPGASNVPHLGAGVEHTFDWTLPATGVLYETRVVGVGQLGDAGTPVMAECVITEPVAVGGPIPGGCWNSGR